MRNTNEVRRRLTYELAGVEPLAHLPAPAACMAIRKRAGVSLEVAGNAIGVSWLTLRGWELGEHRPTGPRHGDYARVLAALKAMARDAYEEVMA